MNTLRVSTFEESQDKGYLGDNQNWWFDSKFPHAFCIFDLDGFYEENYFEQDHVGARVVESYVQHVLAYGRQLLGREVKTVLELGCGGGWFTKQFLDAGVDIQAVEGTRVGRDLTLKRGVPANRVLLHDLRKPLDLGREFDIVVCTEVAEHIECPFSSQLVHNIVSHGKLAWFSFEEPDTNAAHYHHCNEQPEAFWVNLFKFNGFRVLKLPAEVTGAVEGRGDLVFFSDEIPLPEGAARDSEETELPTATLGRVGDHGAPPPQNPMTEAVKQLVPPLLWNGVRRLLR